MYSLIIVEDNDKIRSGLVNLFPWEETGFTISGDFANGFSAWNYLKGKPETNAVLADIRMPLVDGLELSRLIVENCLDTKIVLMSAYQDFSYAQQALHYNVKEFLIKPLKHSTLMLTFLKIKDELNSLAVTQKNDVQHNQYYEQIIRIVKSYITENLTNANLGEAAALVNLSCGYLSRLFKNYTQNSFSEFLLKKRMERACTLLNDFSNRIYEISDAVGYDNPKNFSRTFKKYYNISPMEFRHQGGMIP